jgi:hypothetical protein
VKPDWKDAPEWANYLAMDDNDEWYWHEYDPFFRGPFWKARMGRYERCNNNPHWTETKEARPALLQVSRNEKPC